MCIIVHCVKCITLNYQSCVKCMRENNKAKVLEVFKNVFSFKMACTKKKNSQMLLN